MKHFGALLKKYPYIAIFSLVAVIALVAGSRRNNAGGDTSSTSGLTPVPSVPTDNSSGIISAVTQALTEATTQNAGGFKALAEAMNSQSSAFGSGLTQVATETASGFKVLNDNQTAYQAHEDTNWTSANENLNKLITGSDVGYYALGMASGASCVFGKDHNKGSYACLESKGSADGYVPSRDGGDSVAWLYSKYSDCWLPDQMHYDLKCVGKKIAGVV